MHKIASFITKKPLLIIIVSLALLVPAAIGYFNTFVNYDILSYLPKQLNSVQGEDILDTVFHNSASSIIIIKTDGKNDAKYIAELKEKISAIDCVSNVLWTDSIVDITVPSEILPDILTSVFYSGDGKSTMMMVQYSTSGASEQTSAAIREIRSMMNEECFMSGISAIMEDTKQLAESQAPMYIAVAIVLALAVLAFTMNSVLLPFVLLAALGIAVIYNMGTNFVFGGISYITQCIAAILQLGVTMDYSVFLIDRYEEEKRYHPGDRKAAMSNAIVGTFTSLCGSSLTTVFGFLALCFMSFTLGLDIGLVMAKGVVLGVLTVVIVLPAMMLLLDKPIHKLTHRPLVPSFSRFNNFTIKHRKVFSVIFALLLIPAFILSNSISLNYNVSEAMPDSLPSIQALNLLKTDFNMATTHFIIVSDEIAGEDMTALTEEIEAVDGVKLVLSLSSFIGPAIPMSMLPAEVKSICTAGGYQLMMVNTDFVAASDEINSQIEQMRSIINKYDPDGYFTGEGVMTKDLIEVTDRDFKITSLISILAIALLIGIFLQSFSLPVILVLSIELAIMLNKACALITGADVSFISPTIIGCVQLGATVDYSILLSTRFREEIRKGKDKISAMQTAAAESSRSIFQSALVFFAATFGVYCVCDIDIIKGICALLARGAIISGVIIIVFLPALLTVLNGIISKTTYNWDGTKEKKSKKKTKQLSGEDSVS